MTGDMARITSVGHVGIHARDLARLVSFYRDVVGLKQILHIPNVVGIFAVGDADFFISHGEARAAAFDFAAADVDGVRAQLVAAKVECTEPRDDSVTGHRSFTFTDREGNRIAVVSAHKR